MKNMTIDQLIDTAVEHATAVLVGKPRAELIPTWHIQFKNRPGAVYGTPWPNAEMKRALVYAIGETMREPKMDVHSYSFMSEAWKATESAKNPIGLMPSEREDKIEVVMINACDWTEGKARMLEIVRGPDGVVTELRHDEEADKYDSMGGDLLNLLLKDES